jgi:anti-sigma regulatory factor (Ser/Thr protein kinase)
MRETTAAPLITWSRVFPAVPRQAGEARRFLSEILDGRPVDDATLCLSELVSNACLHSASARHGGCLTIRVQLHGARLRVEVRDEGGPWSVKSGEDTQGGRGLLIVDWLATAWGRGGSADSGWITWFEMEPCS